MDLLRYYLAIIMLVAFPSVLPFWLLVHPFIRFWRHIGLFWTYVVQSVIIILIVVGVFLVRGKLLMTDFGANRSLAVLSVPILVLALYIDLKRKKVLTEWVRFGFPELAPEKYPTILLKDGIYARFRHPIYVSVLLGMLAFALFINYLSVYLLFILIIVAGYFIVRLCENALRNIPSLL